MTSKDKATRAEKLIENYVRSKVRSMLKEGMTAKASMVITSHLSDVQELVSNKEVRDKINFAKFLLMNYPNTSTSIDPDEEYQKFKEKYK